jgi:phage-related protein
MISPILVLPPTKWEFSQETKIQTQITKLGDGYGVIALVPNSLRNTTEIVIPNLSTAIKNNIISLFIEYGGITKFSWRPLDTFPYKEYICDKWSVIQQGVYLWQITATFTEQKTAEPSSSTAIDRLKIKYFPLDPIADFTYVRQYNYGAAQDALTSHDTYPGSGAFIGGVLLQDGRVFCVPYNSTTARIYNPVTNILTIPGGTYPGAIAFAGAFAGGVLLSDSRVFCVPYNSTTARIYNPITNATTTPGGTYPGNIGLLGGVLLADGRVFCVPHNSTTARIYNPVTNATTTPNGTYPGNKAFAGGVLLTDGRVFCVPHNSTTARIYNPTTDTLATPNGTYPGNGAFFGGVLLADGRVFCVPHSSTTARVFDPATNTLTTPSGISSFGFVGGVLLPDKNVFCVPAVSSTGRIYNPITNTLTATNSVFPVGGNTFYGGVLLPDGRVFCVPLDSTTARIYGTRLSTNLPMGRTHSAFDNKL